MMLNFLIAGVLIGGMLGALFGKVRDLSDRVDALENEAADPHGVGHLVGGGGRVWGSVKLAR